ncbi:MAG: SDR family NAD(P)-dependent oxidoreductase [Dermatophilaceae bacterium]
MTNDRVAVVTGANRGLGSHIVRAFADDGWRVLAVTRGAPVPLDEGLPPGRVETVHADLSDLRAVRALAADLAARHPQVLVNNAALLSARRVVNPQGVELALAVNALAPTVLESAVAGDRGSGATVVDISSGSVAFADLDDLQSQKYTANRSYSTSKLARAALVLEAVAASESGAASGSVVASGAGPRHVLLDPGPMRTGMGEDLPGFLGVFNRRLKPNPRPLEDIARSVLDVATRADLPDGAWIDRRGQVADLPRKARPGAARRALAAGARQVLADALAGIEGRPPLGADQRHPA